MKIPQTFRSEFCRVWDEVIRRMNLTSAFSIARRECGEECDVLWDSIFARKEWIEQAHNCHATPVLVGPYLSEIQGRQQRLPSAAYNVLLLMNNASGVPDIHKMKFLKSLHRRSVFDEAAMTVSFPLCKFRIRNMACGGPRLIVHVSHVLTGEATLPPDAIRNLFRKGYGETQYTFAGDRRIYTLDRSNVSGPCGPLPKNTTTIPICAIQIPKGGQYTLRDPTCPSIEISQWPASPAS